jgi:hypothetical protein
MIASLRHHRIAIGLVAAYALLLSTMLPAFASAADPLQAYLGAHLCGPDGPQGDNAPITPAEHQQKCQLCGPSCAMGGHAPVAALADGAIPVALFAVATAALEWSIATGHPTSSLYPSDIFSQGPPRTA